jgi:hypothetical protein|nr:MAG TPA: hypothetical protein [Caudoviricetes sp.]
MEEIKILAAKAITNNSSLVLLTIDGVKYAFTEATVSAYSNGCSVSIHTNLIKL